MEVDNLASQAYQSSSLCFLEMCFGDLKDVRQ